MCSALLPGAVTFLLLFLSVQASCIEDLVRLQRRDDDNTAVQFDDFGYNGANGSLLWAATSPDSEICAFGEMQSPINLDESIDRAAEPPKLNIPYTPAAEFVNRGSTVQVNLDGTNTFLGKEFKLLQYHLHTPSEHHINGEYYPLELHFVHQAEDETLGVIGLLFQLSPSGCTTPLLLNTTANLHEIATPGTATETAPLDFGAIAAHLAAYPLYTYTGSLTTPPCTEGVRFVISQEPLPLDVHTYNRLKGVMKYNARPIQSQPGEENVLELACREYGSGFGNGGGGGG